MARKLTHYLSVKYTWEVNSMELKNENMNERGLIYGKWMTSPNT